MLTLLAVSFLFGVFCMAVLAYGVAPALKAVDDGFAQVMGRFLARRDVARRLG
jgi:hypothetical protein